MMNKFITTANKLDWPVVVQINRFIKFLPMSLCQFVISHATPDFEAVKESICVYQDMIEVYAVTHTFTNVSFVDDTCNSCGKDHQSLCCLSLQSVIEMEISSKETYRPRNKSYSPENGGDDRQGDNRLQSDFKKGNGSNRNRRFGGSQYRGNNNRNDRNSRSCDRHDQSYNRRGNGSPYRQYGYRYNNCGYSNNNRGRGYPSNRFQNRQCYQCYNNYSR